MVVVYLYFFYTICFVTSTLTEIKSLSKFLKNPTLPLNNDNTVKHYGADIADLFDFADLVDFCADLPFLADLFLWADFLG